MNNRRNELLLASSREYCKCVVQGNTIKYNQLETTRNVSNHTFYGMTINASAYTGIITIVGTSNYTSGDANDYVEFDNFNVIAGHKYFVYTSGSSKFCPMLYNASEGYYSSLGKQYFATPNFTGVMSQTFRAVDLSYMANGVYVNEKLYCQIFDLTEMGLDNVETASQFFATEFGKYVARNRYLAPTSGSFLVQKAPIQFKGVNILDEKWTVENSQLVSGKIKVIPCIYYYYFNGSGSNCEIYFYDKSNNLIKGEGWANGGSFLTTLETDYIIVKISGYYGTTYKYDICINEYNENYNGRYHKSCNREIFVGRGTIDFEMHTGDTYKSWNLSGIDYNQLITNGNFLYESYWSAINCSYSIENNIATITPTAIHSSFRQSISGTNGHKYYYSFDIKYANGETYILNISNVQSSNTGTGQWEHKEGIISVSNTNEQFNIYDYDNNVRSEWHLKNVMLIDLTQLYGAGNEPTSVNDFNATELGQFVQQGYYLDYSEDNAKLKKQFIRTMIMLDLSQLDWTYVNATHVMKYWQASLVGLGIKEQPNAICEKYKPVFHDPLTVLYNSDELVVSNEALLNFTSDSVNSPTGLILLELDKPQIVQNYEYTFLSQAGIITVKSPIGDNMISRRVIKVQSENGVDLNFTKE